MARVPTGLSTITDPGTEVAYPWSPPETLRRNVVMIQWRCPVCGTDCLARAKVQRYSEPSVAEV
eukprot:7842977-Lingulodinium_polyedra.AAC.1